MVKAEQRAQVRSAGSRSSRGIDLEVAPGEVMCIVGPSGSGKSTFLRCINHLEKIDAGRLSVDGELVGYRERGGKLYEMRDKEVAATAPGIGMVFQRFNLFPHMTALREHHGGADPGQGRVEGGVRERAQALLDRVGLGDRGEPTRASSPAASSSGWRSPGRWRWSPS